MAIRVRFNALSTKSPSLKMEQLLAIAVCHLAYPVLAPPPHVHYAPMDIT